MNDISTELLKVMQATKCSSEHALFLILTQGEDNGIRVLQPESLKEVGGGLCDKSNLTDN